MVRDLFAGARVLLFLLTLPLFAWSQTAERTFRVGYLGHTSLLSELENTTSRNPLATAFVDALRARGWYEGKNVQFVWRSAEGKFDRLSGLAQELVSESVDVIVASGVAVDAAAQATKTIPIVMASHYGPVPRFADSLGRPGRNVTGLTQGVGPEIQRQLALLKETSPRISRVALVAQRQGAKADRMPEIAKQPRFVAAANALGLELFVVSFDEPSELRSMIRLAASQGANALLFDDIGILAYPEHQRVVVEETRRYRLLVMHYILSTVESGGLMAFGRDSGSNMRRAAYFVDRILKGDKASELPIEQPERIEFHINLTAAKAIGLEFPPSVILQADRVIQ